MLWYLAKVEIIPLFFPGPIYYFAAFELFIGNFIFVYSLTVGIYWVTRDLHNKGNKVFSFSLIKYTLLTPIYWVLMSIAAIKAAIQLVTKPFYWEKRLTDTLQWIHIMQIQKWIHRCRPTNKWIGELNVSYMETIKIYYLFLVLLLELGVGYYLTSIYGFMSGDASSRVANAFYVLYSREPSLANIGFVWNPLPSFMEMILLVFYPLFPALASEGLAAVIVSSLFAALTVALLVKAGKQFGLNKWLSIIFALLYAFNPYIFYYGANGLTEVIFIYFINIAVIQMLL